ncbi:MAG: histidine--tRNA ligase family protein [Chloroflexi bacterium]|nr:histidine--tRNA ligase family protein [Chloroflexota bacterium]
MELNKCKGFNDLTGNDMTRFRCVEDIFRLCGEEWGYEEIRTPALEYLHLFTQAGTLTPGMLRRAYSFLDWDGWTGSRVVMRPDSTIPAVRHYINEYSEGVARFIYSTPIYVFDVNENKNRERLQFGAELIGKGGVVADSELINMAADVLQRLGREDVQIKLSHAGLIRRSLEEMGLSPKEREDVFNAILNDKKDIIQTIINDGQAYKKLQTLLSVGGSSSAYVKNLVAALGQDLGNADEVKDLANLCDILSAIGVNYEVDFTIGKGFEYYTGMMFRVYVAGQNVGGGGRYDKLIPTLGGDNTPAAGFALYVDYLMGYVDSEEIAATAAPTVLVNVNALAAKDCFDIAAQLREDGFNAVIGDEDECCTAGDYECCCSCRSGYDHCVCCGDDGVFTIVDSGSLEQTTAVCVEEVIEILAGKYEQS